MSKRQSRSAVFQGKFLNTLKNLKDTPAAKRDQDWGRRAVGFAHARIAEAEVLSEQAEAFLRSEDGPDRSLPIGTDETPVTASHTALHTGYKLLRIAEAYSSEALGTLATVRQSGLHSPPSLFNRGRKLLQRVRGKAKRIQPRLRMINATRHSRGVKPSKRGRQPKQSRKKNRRRKGGAS